jgi:3'-phosphoadenosine 5'-phosphosulfate (PAPS) 3'-phosphatase
MLHRLQKIDYKLIMQTENSYTQLLEATKDIAREAGRIIMGYKMRRDFEVVTKPDGSKVTTADYKSHDYVMAALKALTPDIPIISEEDGIDPSVNDYGELYWTVDPLDGTHNFIDGSNWFYVKIALVQKGEPVLGVVYIPVHDEMYFTAESQPSFLQRGQDEPEVLTTTPSDEDNLEIITHGMPSKRAAFPKLKRILDEAGLQTPDGVKHNLDAPGPLQLTLGHADIDLDPGTNGTLQGGNGYSWDYAPDALLLRNAHGVMMDSGTKEEVRFDNPRTNMDSLISFADRNLGKRHFPKL